MTLDSLSHRHCLIGLREAAPSATPVRGHAFSARTPESIVRLAESGMARLMAESSAQPAPPRTSELGRQPDEHHSAGPTVNALIDTAERSARPRPSATRRRLTSLIKVAGFLLLLGVLVAIMISAGVLATSIGH